MKCPSCDRPSLVETMTKGGVLVDVCKTCKGVWLDRGEVFFFSRSRGSSRSLLASEATDGTGVAAPMPAVRSEPARKCRSCGPT